MESQVFFSETTLNNALVFLVGSRSLDSNYVGRPLKDPKESLFTGCFPISSIHPLQSPGVFLVGFLRFSIPGKHREGATPTPPPPTPTPTHPHPTPTHSHPPPTHLGFFFPQKTSPRRSCSTCGSSGSCGCTAPSKSAAGARRT